METQHPAISARVLLAMEGFRIRLLPDDDSGIIPKHGLFCANLYELSARLSELTGKLINPDELAARLTPNSSGFVYWGTKQSGVAILPIPKLNYQTELINN